MEILMDSATMPLSLIRSGGSLNVRKQNKK
jgi:hypothetical protein